MGHRRSVGRSSKLRTVDFPYADVRQIARSSSLDTYVILEGGVSASLEWRSCHFGGTRVYFKCPRCGGRACILYRFCVSSNGVDQYGCQSCLDMVHPVENEGKLERACRRNHKAISGRIYDPTRPQGKPLWMRWPTWKRLSDQFKGDVMTYIENHEKILVGLRRQVIAGCHNQDSQGGFTSK